MSDSGKLSLAYRAKRMACGVSLLTLGVSFELASKHSDELKAELAAWEDGRRVAIGILPSGPWMNVRKEGGILRYVGKGEQPADLRILFKNMDLGFLILTGQISAPKAFAEHRALVHGSVDQAMEINRAMATVQKYLFPEFMLKKGMKRPPTYTSNDMMVKLRLNASLGLLLAINAGK
jgi:hypothetical protein